MDDDDVSKYEWHYVMDNDSVDKSRQSVKNLCEPLTYLLLLMAEPTYNCESNAVCMLLLFQVRFEASEATTSFLLAFEKEPNVLNHFRDLVPGVVEVNLANGNYRY